MDKDASQLEERFVYDVYDNIAPHFDHTRHSQWTGVKRFLFNLPPYSVILDVGCGNGKYLNPDRYFLKMGCDRSMELCKICNKKGFNVFAADCLSIPVVAGRFDAVLSIAVIHHLANEERRLRALKEILDLLRPGGRALIYVWAFEQSRNGEASHYLKDQQPADTSSAEPRDEFQQVNTDLALPIHDSRTQFRAQDLLVPWTKPKQKDAEGKDTEKLLRYYHVFKEGELEAMCLSLGGCILKHTFYELGNWCIELEKNDSG